MLVKARHSGQAHFTGFVTTSKMTRRELFFYKNNTASIPNVKLRFLFLNERAVNMQCLNFSHYCHNKVITSRRLFLSTSHIKLSLKFLISPSDHYFPQIPLLLHPIFHLSWAGMFLLNKRQNPQVFRNCRSIRNSFSKLFYPDSNLLIMLVLWEVGIWQGLVFCLFCIFLKYYLSKQNVPSYVEITVQVRVSKSLYWITQTSRKVALYRAAL